MIRPKREKDKKYRVNITLDERVILEIGNYIDNLSGYINAVLKKYIANRKELEKAKNTTKENDTHNNLLCKNNKKSSIPSIRLTKEEIEAFDQEAQEEGFKWW